jgi:hypothetical protein
MSVQSFHLGKLLNRRQRLLQRSAIVLNYTGAALNLLRSKGKPALCSSRDLRREPFDFCLKAADFFERAFGEDGKFFRLSWQQFSPQGD